MKFLCEFFPELMNDVTSITRNGELVYGSVKTQNQLELTLDDKVMAQITHKGSFSEKNYQRLAPVFALHSHRARIFLKWLKEVKALAPDQLNWIGFYFTATFLFNEASTDLIVGPYFGEWTHHQRIPLNKGICGMAVREDQTINIEDVSQNPEYLSCSVKTKSELVIPLKNSQGITIGELDIDSHELAAFSPELTAKIEEKCLDFKDLINE